MGAKSASGKYALDKPRGSNTKLRDTTTAAYTTTR